MRRIGDELALGASRLLERGEHRVEARGEPAELVVTDNIDALGEVLRLAHALDGRGESSYRRERRSCDEQPEACGDHHAAGGDQQQKQPDAVERLVDLVERSRDLDRSARAVREREDAEVLPVDVDIAPERGGTLAGDGQHIVVNRELDVLPWRNERAPVLPHELRVPTCLAELRPEREKALALPRLDDTERLSRDLRRARLERLVHGSAKLFASDEVEQDRRSDDRECDRRCR